MLHSAGKTTVAEMKVELAEGTRAAKIVPGDKPDKPDHGKPGTDMETPNAPTGTTDSVVTRQRRTQQAVAAAVEQVGGRSIKREYGYILSHIPFGPSIAKTLASI